MSTFRAKQSGPDWRWGWLVLIVLLLTVTPATPLAASSQAEQSPRQSFVFLVHASPATGPVDVYIDGVIVLIGLSFAAVSDPIALPAGDHTVELVPSAGRREDAVASATVSLAADQAADLALIGPSDDLRLETYPVDRSPLPPNLARFGAVLGSFDTGPVDLAVSGGDLLFPTIEVAAATEFADLAAGVYDLEVRYGGTEAPVLALPGTVLEPGIVYRLYIVGEAALGELQPVIAARPAESAALAGHPAWIQRGRCDAVDPAAAVADLTLVAENPFAERAGHPEAQLTESSYTAIAIPYGTLLEQDHVLAVAEAASEPLNLMACGEIGGVPTVDGSLVVALRPEPGSTAAGIAVLSPNVLDPGVTDVSVFIAPELLAEGEQAGGEADSSGAAVVAIDQAVAVTLATPAAGD